jgi:hypothetical protein
MRLNVKLLIDFTCCMHYRHCYEAGGILFCYLVVQNQAICFVAAKLYLEYYDGGHKIEAEVLWWSLSGLLVMFVLSVTAFFALIDRTYLHTFTTTMTASQYCVKTFRDATSDAQRIEMFKRHPSYYASINDEVKTFVGDNWATWKIEQPDWFTENVIGTIPDWCIPAPEVERMNKEGPGLGRKRTTLGDLLGSRRNLGVASVTPIED